MEVFDLTIFQLLMVGFIQFFFVGKIVRQFLKHTASIFDVLLLLIVDVVLSVLLIQPDAISSFSRLFGIGRGTDFFLYLGFIGITFLLFRIFYKLEKMREDITKLNYQLTIEKHKNEQSKGVKSAVNETEQP